MEIMNQPFTGQLGDRLIESLHSSKYKKLDIIVAFAKNSGVLRIKNALENFRNNGGEVNIYLGVDLLGTSYEALTALLINTDNLNIIHAEKCQTFHSKIYRFSGDDDNLLIVGSHNLTGGGLWTNFESSIFNHINNDCSSKRELLNSVDDYIEKLSSLENYFMPIKEQDDIDKLLNYGYICKEVIERINSANSYSATKKENILFGNGTKTSLPRIFSSKIEKNPEAPSSSKNKSVSLSEKGITIWFETKRMTGGSRNILDLSMRSLVEYGDPTGTEFDLGNPQFMSGAVEFFGLNPTDVEKSKDITINFEGVDYKENTILFPVGGKANGTWRLQIKGRSTERKITEAFREKEENYLVMKIITFTKIQDDYYSMSVFLESEMDKFIAASIILARNGSTQNAKRLGII